MADKKVVIIDDNAQNRYILKTVFKLFGPNSQIEIAEGSSAVKSVEFIRSERPDLVLMDIRMEREDAGIEAVKVLKKLPELKGTKYWAVTALASEEDKERCLEAGFDFYLPKPVDQVKILERFSSEFNIDIPPKVKKRMGII